MSPRGIGAIGPNVTPEFPPTNAELIAECRKPVVYAPPAGYSMQSAVAILRSRVTQLADALEADEIEIARLLAQVEAAKVLSVKVDALLNLIESPENMAKPLGGRIVGVRIAQQNLDAELAPRSI